MPTNPNTFDEQIKEKVLAHIELYRLTIPRVVAKLFFPAHLYPDRTEALRLAETFLQSLVDAKLLAFGECPAETQNGAAPKYYLPAKAKPGEAAIGYDLACLWFCFLSSKRRYRLERDELAELIANPPYKNIRHCIEPVRGVDGVKRSGVIYRLYPTTAETKEIARQTRTHIKKASKAFSELVNNGDYGFAILTQSKSKAKEVHAELHRTLTNDTSSISSEARLLVEFAPQTSTLAAALTHSTTNNPKEKS